MSTGTIVVMIMGSFVLHMIVLTMALASAFAVMYMYVIITVRGEDFVHFNLVPRR